MSADHNHGHFYCGCCGSLDWRDSMILAMSVDSFLRLRVLLVALLFLFAAILSAGTPARCAEQDSAQEILQAAGVKGGLIVHIGCDNGKLTAALRVNDRYLVHGLDTDPGKVRQARQHIRDLAAKREAEEVGSQGAQPGLRPVAEVGWCSATPHPADASPSRVPCRRSRESEPKPAPSNAPSSRPIKGGLGHASWQFLTSWVMEHRLDAAQSTARSSVPQSGAGRPIVTWDPRQKGFRCA